VTFNPNLVYNKLDQLKNYLKQIDTMNFDEVGLVDNVEIQQLLSFRLQQAIETTIQIAVHLVANLNLPRQESAADAFVILGNHDIISQELANNLTQACGFRNIIVHGYQKIDFHQVYRDYKQDLKDLYLFIKQISHFMKNDLHQDFYPSGVDSKK
jgi:uncharacterized protein YutE (UPF0331/DUF86 family)